MTSDSAGTADSPAERDLSGRQLGDYRLLRRLGRGAMAEVYLAEQGSLRRNVALKILHSDLAKDESYVRRFHLEARAAASLVHANIVQIHEVGCAEGFHFIAQEYVQGSNLSELLARRGPPDLKSALRIMRQVAAALGKAAERGIIHRDIKPENIMLAASGEVKVADFGLARQSGEEGGLNLTRIGFTMGTPLYMSPEQVEGKPLDPRSDIYSFGVTCFQMLAGEPPFRGETALNVAVQHLNSAPPRLENLRADLPAGLCRVVHKMLAKEPADRYATARELLRDLRSLALGGIDDEDEEELRAWADAETEPQVSAHYAATQRLAAAMRTAAIATRHRRRAWLLPATVVLLALAAGAGLAWLTRPSSLLALVADGESFVTKFPTAESQLFNASQLNSEAAWKSVIKYFPENKRAVLWAEQGLARMYLDEGDYKQAWPLFQKFADRLGTDEDFGAFGLAGEAIILHREGKTQESAEKLTELVPLVRHLDQAMRQQVLVVLRENARRSGQTPRELNRLLEQLAEPRTPQSGGPGRGPLPGLPRGR